MLKLIADDNQKQKQTLLGNIFVLTANTVLLTIPV